MTFHYVFGLVIGLCIVGCIFGIVVAVLNVWDDDRDEEFTDRNPKGKRDWPTDQN
jgi:hypothetical protein